VATTLGDYMAHWLTMGSTLRSTRPSAPNFSGQLVTKKMELGKFIWPGFGENSRVLEWMVQRLEGVVSATPSPIGWLPKEINTDGLTLSSADVDTLLRVDLEEHERELDDAAEFLETFGQRLPALIREELDQTRIRLRQ